MGPEIDVEDRKTKMEASAYKASVIFAKELEDELMKYTTNYEEKKVDAHSVEQTEKVQRNDDAEISIMECTKSGGRELVEAKCLDTTESSSSFDDSDCGDEDVDPALALDFDGFGETFRMSKKRVTTHWRSFVRPLTWRCKWAELQIKKLEEQAQAYDTKLEEYRQQKEVQLEKSDVGVKSLPFSDNYATSKVKVLRRKKRRRREATNDVAAYMAHHNLFSYYENRKYFADGAIMCNGFKNPAKNTHNANSDDSDDELQCTRTRDHDNFSEQILRKIDFLQSQVSKLKSRVEKVTDEKARKFSCLDNLSPYDALVDSPLSTAISPSDGERMPVGAYIASQLISEYKMSDMLMPEYKMSGILMPESVITSYGEVVPAVNGNRSHLYFADVFGNGEDEVLIDNQRVKEEMITFEEVKIQPMGEDEVLIDNQRAKEAMNTFEEVKIQPIISPLVQKDCLGSPSPPALEEPDLPDDDQRPPKILRI